MTEESAKKEWKTLVTIFIAAVIYVMGEVIYKIMGSSAGFDFEKLLDIPFLFAFYSSFPIIIVLGTAFLSRLLMGIVLAKNPFGYSASIFLALLTGLSFILGWIIFLEEITFGRVVGFTLICIGIVLADKRKVVQEEKQNLSK